MELKSFVVGAFTYTPAIASLLGFCHTTTGVLSSQAAPEEKFGYSGSPVNGTAGSAFGDPGMEAWTQPVVIYKVISKNESCIVEEPDWAYDIDKEKNEVVKKVEPTSEEISGLPSMRDLYAFLRYKCSEGNSLSGVEIDLFARLSKLVY